MSNEIIDLKSQLNTLTVANGRLTNAADITLGESGEERFVAEGHMSVMSNNNDPEVIEQLKSY